MTAGNADALRRHFGVFGGGRIAKTDYLLKKQVELVLAALMPDNRNVMRVCLHTGLRVSDVLRMRTEGLGTRMTAIESKTGKRRRIGIPAALVADLRKRAGAEWVFPGRDGSKPRTRQAVWRDVKRAAKAFRLPQNVGTHSARKVYAVNMLHKYKDIAKVQRALNHDSAAVTMIYVMADKLLEVKYPDIG